MSLNGLDDPKVVEAYEGAISEAGGWFLLQYEGRDEIQVLSRGTGGIAEVRNAIAEYEETSPLYGFLKYRRRSVIIKYLPENCTRIIQARVAVHLNAVCERFSPFDTIFQITSANELKDSKLSAACSLHTASSSTSSSTSSRRRRLVEIAEEEEDDKRATKRQSTQDADENRTQSAADRPSTAAPVSLNSDLASSPEQSKFAAATTSDVPQFVGVNEHRTSMDSDTHTLGSYPYSKPKVKLAPRPSVEANTQPQTAGRFRPVSMIPAGFKIFGRSIRKGKGKDGPSSPSTQNETVDINSPTSDDSQDRPKTSSSSVLDSASVPAPTQKKPAITPEKARLMKAMQLREKNKKLAVLPSSDNPSVDDELNHADDDLIQAPDETILSSESDCDRINRRTSIVSKDDSGVALEPSLTSVTHADQTSELTASESHPASSLVGSSDVDQSTKASSISESTDETVHDKEEAEPEEADASAGDASKGSVGINAAPASQDAAETAAEAVASGKEGRETKDPITTIAGLSTTGNIAEDVKGGSSDEGESLENVALPVSKFSASAASGTDDGNSKSPESADGVKKTERAGTTSSSPDLKAKVSAQHLWAATKAASSPTVLAVVPAAADVDVDEAGKASSDLEQRKEAEDGIPTASLGKTTPALSDKTPTTPTVPIFPKATTKGQDDDTAPSSPAARAVSNPVRGSLSPSAVNPSSARSLSSGVGYLQHANQQQHGANNLTKKSNNIGSSISQRIKALEKLSASTGDAALAVPAVRDRPSSTFFAVKKREPPRSPFLLERGNSFRSQTPPSPAESNPEAPVEESRRNRLDRTDSVTNRLSMFEYPTTSTSAASRALAVPSSGNNARSRPESVSVMARIVRDTDGMGQSGVEPPRDPSEYKHLELKQSPLMVDLQKASSTADKNNGGAEQHSEDGASEAHEQSKASKSRQPLNMVKGFINERRKSGASDAGSPTYSQSGAEPVNGNSAFGPSTTVSSGRSSFSKDRDTPASPTDSAVADDANSPTGDKKLSRAGRFMRRLSNISGSRSKNSPSPSSPASKKEKSLEAEPVQVRPSTTGTPTIVSSLGDVNVQFPDNLLWKRRNMSLDSQGFLILSALPVQNGRPAPGTKRYHLSEFRTPYIPDVEVQELPNSVVLDFIEGSSLQVACEDRTGQLRVLQTLQEAHATRGTTYGL
ncbi:hypothetical protein E4U42_000465 [Claviceps africana]|uniref:ADF-H domain-containing protein n=1 Tax=Claviceps africana TaxID=83212 RepID=A0A8K0JAC2_9HYPO|nr:hypothetical protein E4U42_000465 [Claviceps africana]